jgi:hypothetical protein
LFFEGSKMKSLTALALLATLAPAASTHAQDLPQPIQAPGLTAFVTLHAVGAQVYQCKAGADGKLAWAFREPIASLFRDGVTAGQHYAGPSWRLSDGGMVQGKVSGKAPGGTTADIAWLKLDISAHEGQGALGEAAAIQRIHTQGGALEGPCEADGALRAVPYAADYVFLKK